MAFLAVVVAVFVFDWAAQRKHWRLGAQTQRLFGGRRWDYDTIWGTAKLSGGCEMCNTSWRYVNPYPVAPSPHDGDLMAPFCVRCHTEIPRARQIEVYAQWWLDARDDVIAKGEQPPPDEREWAELRQVLEYGNRTDRVVA